MKQRSLIKSQIIQAWNECISEDYCNQRINSELSNCIQKCSTLCTEKCTTRIAVSIWIQDNCHSAGVGRAECKYLHLLDQISMQINRLHAMGYSKGLWVFLSPSREEVRIVHACTWAKAGNCQRSGYAGRECYAGLFVRALKLAWILFQNLWSDSLALTGW